MWKIRTVLGMDARKTAALVMSAFMADEGGRNTHMTLDKWEWPQGVAMFTMMKVYAATGDKAVLEQARNWYDGHIARGLPEKNINTVAPMLGMTFLYEITREEKYLSLIREWSAAIMRDFLRTEEGGLQHRTSDDINDQQLWDDTLFMTVLFLYRAGLLLNEPSYIEEAKYQFLLHIKYLHGTENGLWYHGFCFIGRHHFADAYWARGNSWFTAGALEFLEWLDEKDCVYRTILETWREQCEALKKVQDPGTGLWHTLLDCPDSYLETSASAAIAYGMLKGVRLGLLDETFGPVAEKALSGVLSRIGEDGIVQGVSYGTPMGENLDFYRRIPVTPTAYGQGLVYLMLTERL